MSAKVSVIIPVFRTEEYLEKCVKSVLSQTYKNIEVILVDDGSDDNCPAMCDAYAKEDERVTVIHKRNGGLSSARNAGLVKASGDYVAFVDSDDYIAPDMYEKLMTGIDDSDIAICGWFTQNAGGTKKAPFFEEKISFTCKEALCELFRDTKIKNHVWNKLFKRELFSSVTFPEGKTFEDIMTTYKLFEKAEKVTCIPYAGYYYTEREGAISKNTSAQTCFARFSAHLERYLDIRHRMPECRDVLQHHIFIEARAYVFAKPHKAEELYEIKQFLATNERRFHQSGELSIFEKAQVSSIINRDASVVKLLDFLRKAEKLIKH